MGNRWCAATAGRACGTCSPISASCWVMPTAPRPAPPIHAVGFHGGSRYFGGRPRSEEHTSELQSRENLVCRLLLEKKKKTNKPNIHLQQKKNKNNTNNQ